MSTPQSTPSSCALLTWKNPAHSAQVFGGLIAGLFAVRFLNLVNVFFWLASYGLAASAAAEFIGKKVTGQGFVSKYVPQTVVKTSFARTFNDKYLPHLAVQLEKIEAEAKKLALGTNFELSLKAAAASYIAFKVTSWFSLFTLAVIAVVGAFTLPAIYTNYKTEIDALIAKYYKVAQKQVSGGLKSAQKAAEPHLKTLSVKLAPITLIIQSKLPNHRTAGSTIADKKPLAAEGSSKTFQSSPQTASTSGVEFPSVPAALLHSTVEVPAEIPVVVPAAVTAEAPIAATFAAPVKVDTPASLAEAVQAVQDDLKDHIN